MREIRLGASPKQSIRSIQEGDPSGRFMRVFIMAFIKTFIRIFIRDFIRTFIGMFIGCS